MGRPQRQARPSQAHRPQDRLLPLVYRAGVRSGAVGAGALRLPKSYLVTPLLHPSYIVRGQWAKEPAQIHYLTRVAQELKGEREPMVVDVEQPPPRSKLYPTLSDLDEFRTELTGLREPAVGLDIEGAGQYLICIGFTALDLADFTVGSSLCLRFRLRGGLRAWSQWEQHYRAVEWLWDLLADDTVAKVAHNATHDVTELEADGFIVNGRLIDTMVLAHVAYSEFPKSLEFCATLYLGSPRWKTLIAEGEDNKDV